METKTALAKSSSVAVAISELPMEEQAALVSDTIAGLPAVVQGALIRSLIQRLGIVVVSPASQYVTPNGVPIEMYNTIAPVDHKETVSMKENDKAEFEIK